MTIIEYIKKEWKNIKEKPKKERLAYFWDYYKWHVGAILLVIVLLIQGIVSFCNKKEIVFSGYMLNSVINVKDEDFLQGFYDLTGIDTKNQEAAFYTDVIMTGNHRKQDITAFQRIVAGVSMEDTDFVVMQKDSFRICAYSTTRIFADLREFMDAETLEKYKDKLVYIDGAVLQQLSVPVGQTVDESAIKYPDPTKPETMQEPIPVAINVSGCAKLQSAYYLPNTTLYLGVIANTPRPELTLQFIDYLFA